MIDKAIDVFALLLCIFAGAMFLIFMVALAAESIRAIA